METRLRKGQRYELKSGDELFLSRPNRSETLAEAHFIFVNTRERDIIHRNVIAAQSCSESTDRGEDSQDSQLGAFVWWEIRNGCWLRQVAHTALLSIFCVRVCGVGGSDKYEIGPQIGLGTCGTVHTCREHATGNQYAIKIVDLRKLTLAAGGASINELAAEAEIMRSLNHPNIITVHESWQTSQAIYIVMELVRGGDLFERVVQRTHYSEDNARTLMRALLSAVKYLHDRGIVHRDLKPENILLTDPYDDVSIKVRFIITNFLSRNRTLEF
jgi:serine/threonine protein kinase